MHTVALVNMTNGNHARAIGSRYQEAIRAGNDNDAGGPDLTNRYDGAALGAGPSDASAVPVTVAVGHSASLVSAGLAATLVRTPGCELSVKQILPAACSCESAEPAQLVFGDSTMLKCMQAHNKSLPGTCKFAKAKFVLVTSGYEPPSTDSSGKGEFGECLFAGFDLLSENRCSVK